MESKISRLKKIVIRIPGAVPLYHLIKKLIALPWFLSDFLVFRKNSNKDGRFTIKATDLFPCLLDRTATTGFEPHYTYHPAWAARILAAHMPQKHVDISSTLYFCGIVSAFVPVEFYDYRPAQLKLDNLSPKRGDLLDLPFKDNSIPSLSSMHVIEHIGLGRYGDPLDPLGDKKAAKELSRVLAPGGVFIFVAPVGKSKIAFNAHRIYGYKQVLELFPDLTLKEFSLVPDDYLTHGLIRNADPSLVERQEWGCGCFYFTK